MFQTLRSLFVLLMPDSLHRPYIISHWLCSINVSLFPSGLFWSTCMCMYGVNGYVCITKFNSGIKSTTNYESRDFRDQPCYDNEHTLSQKRWENFQRLMAWKLICYGPIRSGWRRDETILAHFIIRYSLAVLKWLIPCENKGHVQFKCVIPKMHVISLG